MSVAFQPPLFDSFEACERGSGPDDRLRTGLVRRRRLHLGQGAWLDLVAGWLPDADEAFTRLVEDVPWRAERRQMYDRVVDVPRLVCTFGGDEVLPHPRLAQARTVLSEHYAPELGEPFVTAGCCYYRDGHDSVAWHGDRIGRGRSHDTLVAIVSFGSPRRLSLRPRGGGPAQHHVMGHGDLLVMGGSCQRTWDHAVLKTSQAAGPRVSVQFRPLNVL